jgi:hypothetical protein
MKNISHCQRLLAFRGLHMKTWPKAKIERPCVSDRFKKWVRAFGPSRLANSLEKNKTLIYSWISPGNCHRVPRQVDAMQIVALSQHFPHKIGPLTMADFGWKISVHEMTIIKSDLGEPSKRFYEWMDKIGKRALMAKLGMAKGRVGQLMNGGRPSLEKALLIVRLSHEYPHKIGPLTMADIRGEVYSEQKNARI